jgi:ABC-type nitrate/sulfonate/bicarbonate transport system substrate-binding protein
MQKIRIGGVPEHFNYPWHQGIKKGTFKAQDIQLEWHDMPGGTGQMSDALENRELDLAIMLTEGCLMKINQGLPIKVIQQYIATPLYWGIYTHPDSDFSRDELIDKKVAISRYGSGSHLMAIVNAKKNDQPTDSMRFYLAQDLNGAIQSLYDGQADYFLWEHFMTQPYVDRGQLRFLGDRPTPWPCFVIAARNEFINAHFDDMNKLLKSIDQITTSFKQQPRIDQFLAEAYQLKPRNVKEWLALTEWSQAQISPEAIDKVQHYLKAIDQIDEVKNRDIFIV